MLESQTIGSLHLVHYLALLDNKIRVHELAKQLKSTSKRVMELLKEAGIEGKSNINTNYVTSQIPSIA